MSYLCVYYKNTLFSFTRIRLTYSLCLRISMMMMMMMMMIKSWLFQVFSFIRNGCLCNNTEKQVVVPVFLRSLFLIHQRQEKRNKKMKRKKKQRLWKARVPPNFVSIDSWMCVFYRYYPKRLFFQLFCFCLWQGYVIVSHSACAFCIYCRTDRERRLRIKEK